MVTLHVVGREDAGAFAADRILSRAAVGTLSALGVATGSSAEPVYAALAPHPDAGRLLAGTTAYALDEYVGLGPDHPDSYRATLTRQYVAPLGLDPARLRTPDGAAADPDAEAARYEAELRARGGVDLQLLGIGANGHIGFNEPGADLAGGAHVVTLAERTRRDNARFFARPDLVPHRALTQGIGTILRATEIVLLAFGEAKADALARALEGPRTAAVPASVLPGHPAVTVLADAAAASRLTRVGAA